MSYGEVGRGLQDVKLYPLGPGDEPGSAVDYPGARAFEFNTEQEESTWEGDDDTIVTAFDAKRGTGTLRAGRQNPLVLAVTKGGEAVISGVEPALVTTHEESAEPSDENFMIKGQQRSLDTAGSGYRVTIHKAKAGNMSEKMGLKQYNEPNTAVTFQSNVNKKFITREWFQVRTDIPETITAPAGP